MGLEACILASGVGGLKANMAKRWVMKGSELPPGKMVCREVAGESVLFANVAGSIYAVSGNLHP